MSLTKKYLATLYATCKQNGFSDSFPLECYIANFLEVPLPPPGKVGLSFSLPGDKVFNCYSPGLHDFPLVDVCSPLPLKDVVFSSLSLLSCSFPFMRYSTASTSIMC